MKTRERSDVQVFGNLPGEEVPLTLDEKSLPHLISIYTRIYQDPEMAALREYCTNARDSHIAAGKSKKPIRITLPNKLNPNLTIEDEGVGLSADEFKEIYSKYGASTKRGTNRQTGSLGIGCKSALASTSGFNITGVKDGIKTVVSVTRDKSGAGMMKIVGKPTKTTEGNGVKVEIPFPLENRLKTKAEFLFGFWPKGSAIVDGKEMVPIEGLQITKDILITKDLKSNYIVMGGVPYKYDEDILTDRTGEREYKVVAYVEMGAVDFAPSRETLELTPETLKRIEQIRTEATTGLAASIQKKIDKAKSHPEAAKLLAENSNLVDMRSHKFFYKGEEIPYSIQTEVISSHSGSWRQGDSSKNTAVSVQAYSKQLVVTDYSARKFVAAHKKKLEQYVRENQIYDPKTKDSAYPQYLRYFLMFPDPPKEMMKWIDPAMIVEWETIRKIKLPDVGNGGKKVAGTYECWTQADKWAQVVDEDDVDAKNLLLYTSEWRSGPPSSYQRLLSHYHPKWTVAYMAANRKNKFKRLFPNAINLDDYYDKLSQRFKKELSAAEKEYMKYHRHKDVLSKFNPAQIKDTDLRKIVRMVKDDSGLAKVARLCSDVGMYFDDVDPFKNYPLLEGSRRSYGVSDCRNFAEHATLYINAVVSSTPKKASKK